MRRSEVWWAQLDPPSGQRPVLLLSRDQAYQVREFILIAPLTTRIRRIPTEVPLGPKDGLPKRCVVNLDVLATISKTILRQRIATLSPEKEHAVNQALLFALGIEVS